MADRLVAVEVPGRKGQIPIMTGPESLGVIDAGNNGQVLTANSSSPTGVEWSDSPGGWTLVGPGRPDNPATTGGIITGQEPVGAEYRSTDGASVGALVWMKRPGGKWEVTDGDTGWRRIAETVPGIVQDLVGLEVRRITNMVYGRLKPNGTYGFKTGGLQTKITVSSGVLPPEFQTTSRMSSYILADSGSSGLVMQRDGQFWVTITSSDTPYSAWNTSWLPQSAAWPSTLPGTPA